MVPRKDDVLSVSSASDSLAVLEDKHRRAVVDILADKDEDRSVTLSSLAEWIVGDRRDVTREPEQLEIELHHNHLPKLDEADLVDYRSGAQSVVPTDDLTTAERLIETVTAN